MKAIIVQKSGASNVLQIKDVPEPKPGIDEILIRNRYIGINHGDILKRKRGDFKNPILGFEGVGEVIEAGKNTSFKIGDTVAYLTPYGAYAEFISVPAVQVFSFPSLIDSKFMAASICTGTTAWNLLEFSDANADHALLVHGGAGGVGSSILQLAHSRGIRTFATVGTLEKAEYASSCGADVVILHTQEDFAQRVLMDTDNTGIDVIFDCVGNVVTAGNFRCIKNFGKWLYYGSISGPAIFDGRLILSKSINLIGFVIFEMFNKPDLWKESTQAVIKALEKKILSPKIEIFAFSQIREAHNLIENRRLIGKAVIDVSK